MSKLLVLSPPLLVGHNQRLTDNFVWLPLKQNFHSIVLMFNNSRLELLDASFSMASKEYAFRTIQQDLLQNFDVSKDFAKYHTGKLFGLVFGKKPKLTVNHHFHHPPTKNYLEGSRITQENKFEPSSS